MGRTGAVSLDTAFRASHCLGGLAYVEFLPVTQHESLALTIGEPLHGVFDRRHHLRLLEAVRGRRGNVRMLLHLEGFERIALLIFAAQAEAGEEGGPSRAHLLAPEMVANRILENTLEEEGQFRGGLRRVLVGELEHRVLDDIERRLVVAHREHALLEGAPLHGSEEIGQLLRRGQGSFSIAARGFAVGPNGSKPARSASPRMPYRSATFWLDQGPASRYCHGFTLGKLSIYKALAWNSSPRPWWNPARPSRAP